MVPQRSEISPQRNTSGAVKYWTEVALHLATLLLSRSPHANEPMLQVVKAYFSFQGDTAGNNLGSSRK